MRKLAIRNMSTGQTRNQITVSKLVEPVPQEWTEFSIPVPWGHIAGKTYGDPKGSPVLAIHGIMDNSGTFDTLVPLLSKSLYIVAIDLPGHGLSSHLPAGIPYHYIDMVSTLRRITNYFQWKKFSWLGHSLGAGLGAFFSATFPTHTNRYKYLQGQASKKLSCLKSANFEQPFVDRLVMIDVLIPLNGVTGDNYATKISLGVDAYLAMEEKHSLKQGPPSYEINAAVERLIKGTDNALTVETAKILMKRGTTRTADGKYSFSRDFRVKSRPTLGLTIEKCLEVITEIRSPVLFIKAKNSPWYWPPEICQQALDIYKSSCPTFLNVTLEGDHFIHLNEPEKVAGMINQFLVGDSLTL